MTGFFAVRREALDLTSVRPRGFKILLEVLLRHRMTIVEVSFEFGKRTAGESKATLANGTAYLHQLVMLRFGGRPTGDNSHQQLAPPPNSPAETIGLQPPGRHTEHS